MRNKCEILLLAGAIGLSVTGCNTLEPTLRGQSPTYSEGCQDCYGGAGGWGHGQTCENCQGTPLTPRQARRLARKAGVGHGAACPAGENCCGGPGCHGGCCLNIPFHPVHRNFHTYDAPSDLTYPDQNLPPAQVRWPYYTFRGPTDFFMK